MHFCLGVYTWYIPYPNPTVITHEHGVHHTELLGGSSQFVTNADSTPLVKHTTLRVPFLLASINVHSKSDTSRCKPVSKYQKCVAKVANDCHSAN